MRKLLALLLLMQAWTLAQSRFDGTWQMKMDTLEFSGPPEEYLFADGMYHCKSCTPKIDVKTATVRLVGFLKCVAIGLNRDRSM